MRSPKKKWEEVHIFPFFKGKIVKYKYSPGILVLYSSEHKFRDSQQLIFLAAIPNHNQHLNMFPKMCVLEIIAYANSVGRCWGQGVSTLMNGYVDSKRAWGMCYSVLPVHHGGCGKKAPPEAAAFILHSLASRTVRNKFLFFSTSPDSSIIS